MKHQRSKIYGGFVALWAICAVVLSIQSGMAGISVSDPSILRPSRTVLSVEPSRNASIESEDPDDPLSVLIFREPRGKRKLEPRSDSTEWQVIFRWALIAC